MSDSGFSEAVQGTKTASKMSSFSRSELHLSGGCDSPGPSISRSGSVVSLASSGRLPSSPVTPLEVRTLTGNFQKLLTQATEKISSLTEEKSVLEEEQGKLLSTNVEMAIETKKLLLLQKGWTRERQELMAANQEFVEEVERLYKVEERLEREEAEEMVTRLSQELEQEEKDLLEVKAAFVQLSKKHTEGEELTKLKDNIDLMKAEKVKQENEMEDLKAKLTVQLEKDDKSSKILEKLRAEKKSLEQSLKNSKDGEGERRRNDAETGRQELRDEREKVSGLVSRQKTLCEENRHLREENTRLTSKTCHLEQLMGEEVTDINEILSVINNIQASQTLLSAKAVSESQGRQWL